MARTRILGVGFDDTDLEETSEKAMELIAERRAAFIVTPNPEIVMICGKNERIRAAVNGADIVLPDGIGIMLGARILGAPLKQRLPGIDFAETLIGRVSSKGECKLFLLGAKPGVAELAAARLEGRYEGLRTVGIFDGYFSDDSKIKEKISETEPDIILVCLGSPKQELWMSENTGKFSAGVMIGLGGSLDVYSGNVKRAPPVWRRLGLEWLYRLLREPRRIKRAVLLPVYIVRVCSARLRGKNDAG